MTSDSCKIAKYLSALAILLLVSIAFAAPVSAADDFYPDESEEEPEFIYEGDYDFGDFDIPGFSVANTYTDDELNNTLYSPQGASRYLPEAYDMRDLGLVTSVKRQKYGTCWAFAAINSIESNTIKKGYETRSTADFSELQLVYFMYNRDGITAGTPLPSLSGLKGDDVIKVKKDWLHGGNSKRAAFHLATGIGVVRESDVPFEWADPELKLSADYAVDKNAYVVSNVLFASSKSRDDVKELLMDYGCGVISYSNNKQYFNTVEYNGKVSKSYYQKVNTSTSHAVSIVGWDDNYPKENFKVKPKNNGAWLIKNSYGEKWSPDGGFFWLSYDDPSLSDVAFFDVRKSDSFNNIYQYDGSVGTRSTGWKNSKSAYVNTPKAVNWFTAKNNEDITDVSFSTFNRDVLYTVEILNSNKDVVLSQSGTLEHCGYHTVPLTKPVKVNKGEKFAVAVTFSASSNTVNMFGKNSLSMPLDKSYTSSSVTYVSESLPGQGYLYQKNGNEVDVHDKYNANLRIKAFGVSAPTPTPTPTPIPTPSQPKISAAGLSLSSDISVRFYVNDADLQGYHGEYLEVTFNGTKHTLKPVQDLSKPRKIFVFNDISPTQMGLPITAKLYAVENGETTAVNCDKVTYSVKKYCMNQIKKAGAKNTLSTLCVDLLNYGSASQIYCGENDMSKLVNKSLTAKQKSWASSSIIPGVRNDQYISETGSDSVGLWKSASLKLYSDISINLMFTTEKNVSDLTATIFYGEDGKQTSYIYKFTDSQDSKGLPCKCIEFDDLSALELNYPIQVVLKDKKTGEESKTLVYSVDTYADSTKDQGGNHGNLITSMMKYIRSVEHYCGK